MKWYRTASDIDDWFKETKEEVERKNKRHKVSEQKVSEPYRMPLYRGLKLDLSSLPETILLDPTKSEQGMLWFTHPHIRGYDPVEYAENHGTVLLTYPLDCTMHFVRTTYDDGSEEKETDLEKRELAEPTSNTRFLATWNGVIELPEGFVFTYKMEKFIGCLIPLRISKKMLTPIAQEP